ncbi:MAG: hypothetical protein AB3N34_02860 [Lettuce witches'-broom phytoplasma]
MSIYAYTHSYFHKQIKTTIKLISDQTPLTPEQQWLSKQPKLRRHDINVSNKDDIPGMLKYYDITDASDYSPLLTMPPIVVLNHYFLI